MILKLAFEFVCRIVSTSPNKWGNFYTMPFAREVLSVPFDLNAFCTRIIGRYPQLELLLLLLICMILRIVPAALFFGAGDPPNCQSMIEAMLLGNDPYRFVGIPYSPVGVSAFHLLFKMMMTSSLNMHFWAALCSIFGDCFTLVGCYLILKDVFGVGRFRLFLCLLAFALNPLSIFESGFHGQLDQFAIAFVLFAAYFVCTLSQPLLRGGVVGLLFAFAVSLKTFPFVFFPVFWVFIGKEFRTRALFAAVFSVFMLFSFAPQWLEGVTPFSEAIRVIFLQGGAPGGHVGVGQIYNLVTSHFPSFSSWFEVIHRLSQPGYLLLGFLVAKYLGHTNRNIFWVLGAVQFFILATFQRIAVQYAVPALPFLLLLPLRQGIIFSLYMTVVYFVFYSRIAPLSGSFVGLGGFTFTLPVVSDTFFWLSASLPLMGFGFWFFFAFLRKSATFRSVNLGKTWVFGESQLHKRIAIAFLPLGIFLSFFLSVSFSPLRAAAGKLQSVLPIQNRLDETERLSSYFLYGRNFRYEASIDLTELPSAAKVRIIAEDFYLVRVNQKLVFAGFGYYFSHNHGSAYFKFPRGLDLDLKPYLSIGTNVIVVDDNNSSRFQSIGISVRGEVVVSGRRIDLSSPLMWSVQSPVGSPRRSVRIQGVKEKNYLSNLEMSGDYVDGLYFD